MAIDTKTQETLNSNNQSIIMRRGGSPEPSCQLPTAPAHFLSNKVAHKRYNQSEKGKARYKRYYFRHSKQIKAKNAVNHAIRAGKLTRADTLFCKYCYEIAAHYHHPDYSKPLEVVPVCTKCHRKIHKKTIEIKGLNMVKMGRRRKLKTNLAASTLV